MSLKVASAPVRRRAPGWLAGPAGHRLAGRPGTMASMIGRLHHLVIDCPDPLALAAFYSALLGQPITYRSEDFVVVSEDDTTSGLAFQLAPGHRRPAWPDPARPQQMHLDVMVEDVAAAGPQVLALGATKLDGDGVYADPAGHPFCLVKRPAWAPPIPP
jgi:catechol 2,3-dioxygenase-like lactoylglutathione lyase family enzyme